MTAKKKNKFKARKKIIPTPEDFWSRFLDYELQTKLNPFLVHDFVGKDGNSVYREKERCLTVEGFENYLEDNYGMGAIQQYLENRDGRYEDYVSIVARVRRRIREDQVVGGMAGVYNSNLTARINSISDKITDDGVKSVKLLSIDPL